MHVACYRQVPQRSWSESITAHNLTGSNDNAKQRHSNLLYYVLMVHDLPFYKVSLLRNQYKKVSLYSVYIPETLGKVKTNRATDGSKLLPLSKMLSGTFTNLDLITKNSGSILY